MSLSDEEMEFLGASLDALRGAGPKRSVDEMAWRLWRRRVSTGNALYSRLRLEQAGLR